MTPQAPQREMDALLAGIEAGASRPSLLLHCCCGPCASYVLTYLRPYFAITAYYFNPNIYPEAEYRRRGETLANLVDALNADGGPEVALRAAPYEPERFASAVAGLEDAPEGGARCSLCFCLRLEESARLAAAEGFDFFATTLTVSPHKNAPCVNAVGARAGEKYGARYLPSDFKKKNGYLRSIELSKAYGLYRQDYCGCRFGLSARPR